MNNNNQNIQNNIINMDDLAKELLDAFINDKSKYFIWLKI
jgi:hypothetical protein